MADEKNELVEKNDGAEGRRRALPTAAWVVICALALVAGVVAGHFVTGSGGSVSLAGRTALSAGELDSTIATYTYQGQSRPVTAREVLAETQGSSIAADSDGTYATPSASDVLSYAQNQILLAEAEARGLSVSDDELATFAQQIYGSDDLAAIGSAYGLDEETATQILRESALVSKLRDDVCTTELPAEPTEPVEPAEGAEDTPTADYASYVIALLGDEWDGEANTWARTDGTYYATLSGYEISNDAATYAAASAAYAVAQDAYESASSQRANEWNIYTDSVLSQATIQLGSLAE